MELEHADQQDDDEMELDELSELQQQGVEISAAEGRITSGPAAGGPRTAGGRMAVQLSNAETHMTLDTSEVTEEWDSSDDEGTATGLYGSTGGSAPRTPSDDRHTPASSGEGFGAVVQHQQQQRQQTQRHLEAPTPLNAVRHGLQDHVTQQQQLQLLHAAPGAGDAFPPRPNDVRIEADQRLRSRPVAVDAARAMAGDTSEEGLVLQVSCEYACHAMQTAPFLATQRCVPMSACPECAPAFRNVLQISQAWTPLL